MGTHSILKVLILNSHSGFWNFDPKIHFWANLCRKSQSSPYWLKIGTESISRILILIPTLLFSISNPKSIFGQNWAEKFKVVHFDWKLAHVVYRGCWFLFWHQFSEFPSKWELGPVSETACFVWCSCTLYLEGADLFHLKPVTGEYNEEGL